MKGTERPAEAADASSGIENLRSALPAREDCVYTSCFCEENVWKLCHYVRESAPRDLDQFFVLFISNISQKIPLWKQKAGNEAEDDLVIWDYHVILIHKTAHTSLVYDLDSVLPFPCLFSDYWQQGIRSDAHLRPQFGRKFRLLPAATFLNIFASDRSRMRNPDGSWIKPPPSYSCIRTCDCSNNLDSFISMDYLPDFAVGTIFQSSDALHGYMSACFAGRCTRDQDGIARDTVHEGK